MQKITQKVKIYPAYKTKESNLFYHNKNVSHFLQYLAIKYEEISNENDSKNFYDRFECDQSTRNI